MTGAEETQRDILTRPWMALTFFCLPIAAIAASGALTIASPWRGAIWAASLGVMSAACLVNARRCGRIHCYFTGPFLAAMALVSLGYGLAGAPLGRDGWNGIGAATLGGAILLCCIPELILGRYRLR